MVLETLIGITVGYLTTSLKSSKGGKQASDELSASVWEWIRPIFLKEEVKKAELQKFEARPENTENQKAVGDVLYQHLQQQPEQEMQLRNLMEKAKAEQPERMGHVFNYAPIGKQVNNPNIQGDFHM